MDMHYNLLYAYINIYRANSDNGDKTNVYSDRSIFLLRLPTCAIVTIIILIS